MKPMKGYTMSKLPSNMSYSAFAAEMCCLLGAMDVTPHMDELLGVQFLLIGSNHHAEAMQVSHDAVDRWKASCHIAKGATTTKSHVSRKFTYDEKFAKTLRLVKRLEGNIYPRDLESKVARRVRNKIYVGLDSCSLQELKEYSHDLGMTAVSP